MRRDRCLLPLEHKLYPWVALAAGVVMLARMAATVGVFTHTYDEPYHLGSAVAMFEAKKHVVGVQHPTLSRAVPGATLFLSGARLPELRGTTTIRGEASAYQAGYGVMMGSSERYWKYLTRARLSMLLFPLIALLYLYRLGGYLANGLVAVLSTVFFSLEPTILGNGALVTTDAPACAGFLVAMYHGIRWMARPTLRSTLFAAAALAVAASMKYSTLLIVPGLMLVMLIRPLCRAGQPRLRHLRIGARWSLGALPPARSVVGVAIGSYLLMWALFLFDVGPLADQEVFAAHPEWQSIPDVVKNTPIPMPSLVMGGFILAGHNKVGHVSYLNGQISTDGVWYFFLEVLALKQPVGFLLAFVAALAVFMVRRERVERALVLLLPAAVFMTVSMASNLKLGIRHILPLIPLLYLFSCFILARGRQVALLLSCIVLAAIETARVHPDYLGHFNLIAGGSQKADRYLVASDLDWGQDLARLARWLEAEGLKESQEYALRVYSDNVRQLLPILGLDPQAAHRPPEKLLAISASVKRGLADFHFTREGVQRYGADYRWLEELTPIKRIGASIEVYDLTQARQAGTAVHTITNPPPGRQDE